MREEHAPGLCVDWLNAWLAALGITVLLPGVRLRWTDDPVPSACFVVPRDRPLAELVAGALPSVGDLRRLAIVRSIDGRLELPRTVSLDAYADRAALARSTRDWSLAATVTDLVAKPADNGLPHSPFDPPVPKGLTLWERVVACRNAIEDTTTHAADTLAGRGRRRKGNGLGFDVRRLPAGVQPDAPVSVDPLIEILAFSALVLFPVRGNGAREHTRGWTGPPGERGSFRWCAWQPALDRWAIDALLDVLPKARSDPAHAARLGITAWYRSVPYEPRGERDPTRAYGAEREL